ncbi:MAG: hypothetical protein ACKVUS_06125 [Saprospiraceae bacterium]
MISGFQQPKVEKCRSNFGKNVTHPSIAILRPDGKLDIVRRFAYRDYRNRLS